MRIFLYEHTISEEARPDGQSLRTEGRAMLDALDADFRHLPGVTVDTLFSTDRDLFLRLARAADFTLVIAPEFDDLLETRNRWVEEAGGRLLGCAPAAVRLCGDKLALAAHLRQLGVPTPPTRRASEGDPSAADAASGLSPSIFPLVWKPRHGAGSVATFLVQSEAELRRCAAQAAAEGWKGEALLQPFVPGRACSVAFLLGPGQAVPLPLCAQHLSANGRFRYQGGAVPLPADLARRAVQVARSAVDAVPGLLGYVGVDVVLGEAADGSKDWVIEINPRLTTSYVGLRALAESNLAEAMLRIAAGQPAPPLRWRAGSIDFQADGRVTYRSSSPHGVAEG
jgi:hypothetical protein